MTPGHSHRQVRVSRNGLVHRLLTAPLYCTGNLRKVDRSPYPYGPCVEHTGHWYLSTLSVLHRWSGLALWLPDEEPDPEEE
jgi:hypothetical protein